MREALTLGACLGRLHDALRAVARLPLDLRSECEPAVSYALGVTIDLAELAQYLREPEQAQIAGVQVTADGCVLGHFAVSVDAAGWPIIEPIDGPTVFAGSDVLQCYRAARAAARAPLVLLDSSTSSDAPSRVAAIDAAVVLRALRDRFHA
jgi:hypothetical protein